MTPHDENLRLALGAYALGTLEPDEQRAVEAHLVGCATCRAELDQLVDVVPALSKVSAADLTAPEPSADLFDRIAGAVSALPADEVDADELGAARRRRVRTRTWLVAAAAAVVAAGTATGIAVSSGDSTPTQPSVVSGSAHGIQLAVATTELPRGTRLALTVRGLHGKERCHLVALAADGTSHDAGTWNASYDGEARVVRTTTVERAQLRQLTLYGNGGRKLVDVRV